MQRLLLAGPLPKHFGSGLIVWCARLPPGELPHPLLKLWRFPCDWGLTDQDKRCIFTT
jgi:hypothetical protein